MTMRQIAASTRWESFWFTQIPPHIYALLRITIGAVGCVTLFGLRDEAFWSLDGLVAEQGAVWAKETISSAGMGIIAGRVLYLVCMSAFVLMTIGLRSSIAVPLALVALLCQLSWNLLPLSGAHQAMQGFLFCLIWADCGRVWSVDAFLARRRDVAAPRDSSSYVAPLRLVRYQVALIYLASGLWKLYSPIWREGSAVHYVLNNNVFHRFPDVLPPGWEGLAVLATYTTLVWELMFAFMLLFSPTRRVALALGVMIHLGMLALIEIGPFHFVMLAAYPAFLEPQTISGFRRTLQRMRLGRGGAAVSPSAAT
jgi:hypothetical protein